MIPKLIEKFHGVRIYEASWMGSDYSSAGITLPGFGILVGTGVLSEKRDLHLIMHEYGHILQYRKIGGLRFYLFVGIPSLISAWTGGFNKGHQHYWTEYWCNHLAQNYFANYHWSLRQYPSKDISAKTKRFLGI